MARLQRGENEKIDMINDFVAIVQDDNSTDEIKKEAMNELLILFKPLLLKLCDKWSKYFNDTSHKLKPFDDLLADAQIWFIKYTQEKYIIDGDATYNKFIRDHIDQRIRYIYECQLKYYSMNIFPDPNKHQDIDSMDSLETVIYNYSSTISNEETMEDDIISDMMINTRAELAQRIMSIVENSTLFDQRDKRIFIDVICNGKTQDKMSRELGISRTRIVQILRKIKSKLRIELENDKEFWELITQTDIEFDNNNL